MAGWPDAYVQSATEAPRRAALVRKPARAPRSGSRDGDQYCADWPLACVLASLPGAQKGVAMSNLDGFLLSLMLAIATLAMPGEAGDGQGSRADAL
jgi:hypothetical protein